MAPDMCVVCLDLDYDKFAAAAGLHGEDQSLELYPLPRYRIVSRHRVAAAADGGCKLCSVLTEGMLHFWGVQAPHHVDPRPHGLDFDDEDKICIELRPERTLAVTWLDTLWGSDTMFAGIHPRLEFYVDAGKLFPGALSSDLNQDSSRRLQRWSTLLTVDKEIPGPLSVMPLVGLRA